MQLGLNLAILSNVIQSQTGASITLNVGPAYDRVWSSRVESSRIRSSRCMNSQPLSRRSCATFRHANSDSDWSLLCHEWITIAWWCCQTAIWSRPCDIFCKCSYWLYSWRRMAAWTLSDERFRPDLTDSRVASRVFGRTNAGLIFAASVNSRPILTGHMPVPARPWVCETK